MQHKLQRTEKNTILKILKINKLQQTMSYPIARKPDKLEQLHYSSRELWYHLDADRTYTQHMHHINQTSVLSHHLVLHFISSSKLISSLNHFLTISLRLINLSLADLAVVSTGKNFQLIDLCRVAGNTVWSRMASDVLLNQLYTPLTFSFKKD